MKKAPSVYEASARLKSLPLFIVQKFDFTEVESFVCLGLVQGKSLDDLADELQQSRIILRKQFQNLLIKTGADTEAKLVTMVLSKGIDQANII